MDTYSLISMAVEREGMLHVFSFMTSFFLSAYFVCAENSDVGFYRVIPNAVPGSIPIA
jgi:hypothetical protein